ncbi:MAG: hypothetical protein WCW77_00505 [Patescibacteria group bacterium]|jgi:hypothetical protein
MAGAKRDENAIATLLGVSSVDDLTPIAIGADPTTKRLKVDGITEESGHGVVGDNTATVVTAATRVQLPDVSIKRVIVQAHENNAGTIVIGGSTVVAALVGRRGVALYNTQSYEFKVNNLNLLYIDSTESGDKINYYYET